MALSTSAGSGSITSQANTQSPQTSAGSGLPAAATAKNVQPGTVNSLLAGPAPGNSGIPLTSTALSVASLDNSAKTVSQAQQPATKASHHPSTALLAIVIIMFVIAVSIFWMIKRSAKNTTNY